MTHPLGSGPLGKCVIVVDCQECDGAGNIEPFNPYEHSHLCFWCDGTGVAEFNELYDTYEDALEDYPDAVEIVSLEKEEDKNEKT